VLNGGGASDNLHVGSTVNQQAVSDQVNNINECLMGTSEAQNGESEDLDDFLAYLVNQVRSFLHFLCIKSVSGLIFIEFHFTFFCKSKLTGEALPN